MKPNSELLLAFDFGLARIGVASGNTLTDTATPVGTLESRGRLPWQDIDAIVARWGPGQLVVGLPSDDETNPLVQRIRGFAAGLAERYGLPVSMIDESHTSAEAARNLREDRASGRRRRRVTRGTIDSHAACLIAIRWMQSSGGSE